LSLLVSPEEDPDPLPLSESSSLPLLLSSDALLSEELLELTAATGFTPRCPRLPP
jgi:hypothetical protein